MLTTLSAITPRADPAVHSDEALVAATIEAMSPFDHADAALGPGAPIWPLPILLATRPCGRHLVCAHGRTVIGPVLIRIRRGAALQ